MYPHTRLIVLFALLLTVFLSLAYMSKVAAQPPFDCTTVSQIPEAECDALVALYNSTDGDNWTNNTGWLQTNTPCSNWYGIMCHNDHIFLILLSNNRLQGSVSANFSSLPSLTSLFLDNNQLTTIPDFSSLPSLGLLFLDNNQLTTVPDFSGLPSLRYLYLYNNQLTTVPDFSGLPSLTHLNLYNNQLTTVPDFSGLPSLTYLNLYNNQLTTVPDFSGLPSLTYLHLSNNQLTTVPDFSGLPSLTSLSLSNNQLTTVPDFSGLPSLTSLSLFNNQLTTVPDFSALSSLASLYLYNNQLTTVPDFTGLSSLLYLSLDNNQLTTIPDFTGLSSLINLILSNNQLTTVPDFTGLSSLNVLSLRNNQMTVVPGFSNLINLSNLYLSNNPQLEGAVPNAYTALNLTTFYFSETQLCEPQDATFQTWLASIPNLSRTSMPCEEDLLTVYFLAFDNDSSSPANLTARYEETLKGIEEATDGFPNKKALVLADLTGDNNTHILMVENGEAVNVPPLVDEDGVPIPPFRPEYDMGDGEQLGQFLKWALDNHGAAKNVVSFIGHGHYTTPAIDLDAPSPATRLSTSSLFPLPAWVGSHPDFTDSTPHKSLITPYALQQMLEIGTYGGLYPIDVLDLVHCFSATVEELYEVANDGGTPYATMITASPNYTFYTGEMSGDALAAMDVTDTAQELSAALLTAYDTTISVHDMNDEPENDTGAPNDVDHPRQLIAVESAALPAIKTAMDALSAELLQAFDANPTDAHNKLAGAYAATTQFYDTTFCNPQEWEMAIGDALVDIVPFMSQVGTAFGGEVAARAQAVQTAANAAILHSITQNGTPWMADPLTPMWEFNGSGLALYADLHGIVDGDTRILSWVSRFYTDEVSIGSENDNPHPFRFVQGEDTWADVFVAFWDASGLTVETIACMPDIPAVSEIIELEAVGGPNNILVDWTLAHPLAGELVNYILYRSEPGVTVSDEIQTQIGASYTDVGPFDVGSMYCYYVEAVDEAGAVIGSSNTSCAIFGELSLVMPDRNVAPNATEVAVPITAINADGLCIASMDVKIEYNPSVVVATGVANTAFLGDYELLVNTSEAGVVNIAAFFGACQSINGSGALFEVLFDVIGEEGDVSTLDFVHEIESTAIYNQVDPTDPMSTVSVPTRLINGSLTVATAFTQGDVNGDGVVNSFDAFLTFHITLANIVATAQQLAACDVNGDGACNSADTTLILCYAAYDSWQTCGLTRISARHAAMPVTIDVGSPTSSVGAGQRVQVPVTIDNAQAIAGGTIILTYPADIVHVTGITTTHTLLESRNWAINSSVSGILRVAFADTEVLDESGVLFYIEAMMPRESADIRIADIELNVLSGLDWATNLDNEIAIAESGPTFIRDQHQVYLPILRRR